MVSRFAVVAGGALLVSTLGAGAPELGKVPVRASAAQLTLAPGSPQLAKLFTWADTATGTATDEYTEPISDNAGETTIDLQSGAPVGGGSNGAIANGIAGSNSPGKACRPVVTKAKGKFTSGGYMVLEGTCLGTRGDILITGFPTVHDDPHMTIEAWTPTAVTAQFPTVSGVPDVTMHVTARVPQSDGAVFVSKEFDAKFIAALGDPVRLPNKYIVNNVCTLYGACSSAPHAPVGTHWDYSEQTGVDVWTVKIPDHFRLHAIRLVHLTTGETSTSTINASDSETTFKVSWREKLNGHVTGTSSKTVTETCSYGLGDGIVNTLLTVSGIPTNANCSTTSTGGTPIQIPTYNNVYRVEPMVRGPVGMTP